MTRSSAWRHGARTERDKLIIRLLADTGLRVGELLGLRANDLVEQNRNYYPHLWGKGGHRPPAAGAEGLPSPAHLHRAGPAEGRGEHPGVLVPSSPAERRRLRAPDHVRPRREHQQLRDALAEPVVSLIVTPVVAEAHFMRDHYDVVNSAAAVSASASRKGSRRS